MNLVKAEGRLRHCFFGTYSAIVALVFADENSARDAKNGCRNAEIDNVNHSIDYGPTFDVEIRTTPAEQEALFA